MIKDAKQRNGGFTTWLKMQSKEMEALPYVQTAVSNI